MKRAELKHIAGYLPFNLMIASVGLKGKILQTYVMEIENKNDHGIANVIYGVNQIPILRPMSDLTKEIEHNGEKIIPLIELAKITYLKDNFEIKTSSGLHGTCGSKYSFGFHNNSFYMKILKSKRWVTHDVFNQTELFDKLDELHFDYKYDLIKKGLAIDINTLKC